VVAFFGRPLVIKVEITPSRMQVFSQHKLLVSTLLPQLGRILKLVQCTLGVTMLPQLLLLLKFLLGKWQLGIWVCKRVDQAMHQFAVYILVKHIQHPQHMLPQHYLQVPLPIHIAARFLLVWPPWEWLTQGCSQTCDLVGLHLLVRLHIMVDDEVSSSWNFFFAFQQKQVSDKDDNLICCGFTYLVRLWCFIQKKKKSF